MQRADSLNQRPENSILQHSQGGLVHNFFDIETLQKLAKGRKRSLFFLNSEIPDHLNFCPPYFHEYWRPHPCTPGLWGSHLGRVYFDEKEKIVPVKHHLLSSQLPPGGTIIPTYLEDRYMYTKLPFPKAVYRIIAECWFYIRKGWHIHHINNNSLDCKIENLLPLSSTFHMAIHKPYKYKDKYCISEENKISEKKNFTRSENSFTGIFHPRWKGFILVYSGTVSQEPQFTFRDIPKFSKWFLETYSPKVMKGPRKGQELTPEDITMIVLSPESQFLLKFNMRISFWVPPLSLRSKWEKKLPTNEEIHPQWILTPTFQNLAKMQKV